MKSAPRIWGLAAAVALGLLQAWRLRFVQDDAYISFRYAENLARGLGLVWNEGERVEGYTNFLWTVIVAIPHAWHLDVETFVIGIGLTLFAATLAISYALVGTLTGSWLAATLATMTLGLFPSFAAYATGGLETQLQACLVTATAWLVFSGVRQERPRVLVSAGIGTTAALAMLTRMDSFVIVAPLIALYAWAFLRAHGWRNLAALAPAVVVPVVICTGWLAWKLAYYGSLLPNTYRAKVEGVGGLAREGRHFLRTFAQAYAFYLPIACLFVGGWLAWERRLDRRVFTVLVVPLVLWVAYVARVGGDFMEYRLLVPVLPLAFVVTYWVMCELDAVPARAALLSSIVIAGGIWNYRSPDVPKPSGSPISVHDLVVSHDDEWFEIGTVLREAFAHAAQPTIGVGPAGVIPYLSHLPSVDMWGLNDPEVNHFLYFQDELIGHRRLAPLELLERRRVHFLIGFPVVRARLVPGARYSLADLARWTSAFPDEYRLRGRQLIELPLSRDRVLLMVYLIEDASVTRRIDQLGWRHYPM